MQYLRLLFVIDIIIISYYLSFTTSYIVIMHSYLQLLFNMYLYSYTYLFIYFLSICLFICLYILFIVIHFFSNRSDYLNLSDYSDYSEYTNYSCYLDYFNSEDSWWPVMTLMILRCQWWFWFWWSWCIVPWPSIYCNFLLQQRVSETRREIFWSSKQVYNMWWNEVSWLSWIWLAARSSKVT